MQTQKNTQTAKAMSMAIGQTVEVRFEDLIIPCIVRDVKAVWGRHRLLIQPVTGFGEQWIEMGRIFGMPSVTGTEVAR